MKSILVIFISFFILCSASAQTKSRKIFASKGGDNGCLITADKNLNPGDTVVISAKQNPWSYFYFGNIHGSAGKPIVIINEGVVELASGFDIENCQYIKLTGSGSKEKFGFRVEHSGGVALTIHGKSANIEAERFYARDCAFGCWIKNEADCDTTVNSWVLDKISVHDYEMRDIKIEAFYMGSTDANNATRPKDCKGVKYFYKPSKLGNIKIYNGYINGTGRPAIMLSNAQIGMSEIYNNVVMNVGRESNEQQGTGISLGLYTRAYVHHNTVKNTLTWGIVSLGGSGLIRIENNKIDSSGFLDGKKLDWVQNIAIDTRPTLPADTTRFIIINNTLGAHGKSANHISVWKTFPTYSKENLVCNNKANGKPALVDVAPGIYWRNCGKIEVAKASSNINLLLIGGGIFLLLVAGLLIYFMRRKKPASNVYQHHLEMK